MATLTFIREKQKVVMWVFLIIFLASLSIGGLVGGANILDQLFGSNISGDAVGAVNSQRITITELSEAISTQTQNMRAQYGELNDRLIEQAEEQAWESLVTFRLLTEELEHRNLSASPEEIYWLLQYYPPQFIQQNPSFQRDGQFDPAMYYRALENPAGNEWAPIENYIASLLPGDKLTQLVLATTYTSEEEVKSAWYERNTTAEIEFIYVPNNKINTSEMVLDEADIRREYKRKKDDFALPERRVIEYVYWEKTPTARDSINTRENARDMMERVESGEDFATLARTYSEDPGSAQNGGDLGWFSKSAMPFSDAAFAAKAGDIVGPVQTRFGFHIIKVEDKRTTDGEPQVKASHILLNVTPGARTINELRSEANIFSFDAIDSSFAIAVARSGKESITSPQLRRDNKYLAPPVGLLRSVIRFAYLSEADAVSEVLDSDGAFVVARLAEVLDAGIQPLEDVKTQVERTLRNEAAEDQVDIIMANIEEQITTARDWKSIADDFEEANFATGVSAKLNGSFPGLGRSPILLGVLKAMKVGSRSAIIDMDRGKVIVRLTKLDTPDWSAYEAVRAAEHEALYNRRLNAVWMQWISDLRDRAEIIDRRYLFF